MPNTLFLYMFVNSYIQRIECLIHHFFLIDKVFSCNTILNIIGVDSFIK